MILSAWLVLALVIQLWTLHVTDVQGTSIQGVVESNLNPFASQIITLYRSATWSRYRSNHMFVHIVRQLNCVFVFV